MQRFRIKKDELINFSVFHKGEKITQKTITGFSDLKNLKKSIIDFLPWNYKGYGRRIEIKIVNRDTDQIKYINTFS
jgi:hypothetical protein